MTLTNPRIIVVDASQSLHHLVRAALELMGRRPRLIETHTAEDALVELRIGSPDLLITTYSLVGTSNGSLLALQAKRELAALPIIVIANEDDPELDAETLAQSPFAYLRRPVAAESFLREMRVALDGPEAAPKPTAPEEEMIPVPPIDAEKMRNGMFRLMRDIGAMAVVLGDRNGKVITYDGAAGYIDRDMLAAVLAPGFGAALKLLTIVGEQPYVLKQFDGKSGTIFGLSIGLHYFMLLIFDGNAPPAALGAVKRFGTAAVNEMLGIIGPIAFDPKPILAATPHPAHTAQKEREAKEETHPKRRKMRTQEMTALTLPVVEEKPEPKREEKRATGRHRSTDSSDHERKMGRQQNAAPSGGGFDPSVLDALDKLDMSQADALFDPDKLAEEVNSDSDDKISFDDALLQGIIGDIE